MQLFVPSDEIELIGIGASTRNANEWFQGLARIREIVGSDWQYRSDVRLEVESTKITIHSETAWLSTVGAILQTDHIHTDEVTQFSLNQMKEMLEDENLPLKNRLIEVTHFGVRRLRERDKLAGYRGRSLLPLCWCCVRVNGAFTPSTGRCRWIRTSFAELLPNI